MKNISFIFSACILFAFSCNNKLQVKYSSFDLNQPFSLKMNETAKLNNGDLQLTLSGIPEDSRCPENVTCFWEGQVRATIIGATSAKKENLEFKVEKSKMGKVSQQFQGYAIGFVNVMPLTEKDKRIPLEQYVVQLIVSK